MKSAIIDTNVLFSGLLFEGNERKVLERILQGMLTIGEKIEFIFPEFIYQEIVDVLKRKKAPETMLLLVEMMYEAESTIKISINKIIDYIEKAKVLLKSETHKDIPVIASALASNPNYLITGDKRLHRDLGRNINDPNSQPVKIGRTLVIFPKEALNLL
ncbi:MAG: putative toxin-antitoxin system toxin component, PIN family [Candidatus Freyarchaeota archaeon]